MIPQFRKTLDASGTRVRMVRRMPATTVQVFRNRGVLQPPLFQMTFFGLRAHQLVNNPHYWRHAMRRRGLNPDEFHINPYLVEETRE